MRRGFHTAIVIPARNEARRIGACLSALGPQLGRDALVVVVANNCTDATETRARDALAGPALLVSSVLLGADEGVGSARRIGCDIAMAAAPNLRWLMTTDADCVVAPDWVSANRAHLSSFDAVCGAVDPMPEESDILKEMPVRHGQNEADYRRLVQRFYEIVHPEPHNPLPHHGEAPGASIAMSLSAYRQVGGFADRCTGEDRDLIRRMRQAGLRIGHVSDVRVAASCRLRGRAKGGMADALRDRLAGGPYLVDEALPSVDWLLDHAATVALPAWPPEVPPDLCLRPSELPEQIARLSRILDLSPAGHFNQPSNPGSPLASLQLTDVQVAVMTAATPA